MLSLQSAPEIRGERVARRFRTVGELPRECLERVASSRDDHEVVAIVREQLGEIATDSARCAGHDGNRPTFAASRRCECSMWEVRSRRSLDPVRGLF